MRALVLTVAAALLVAGAGQRAVAQSKPGNAQAGQQFALRSCASCHIVAANQDLAPIPNYGPKFADIAKRPGTTAQSLQSFLSKPHPMIQMPYPDLTTTQVADLTAYILSLGGRR